MRRVLTQLGDKNTEGGEGEIERGRRNKAGDGLHGIPSPDSLFFLSFSLLTLYKSADAST